MVLLNYDLKRTLAVDQAPVVDRTANGSLRVQVKELRRWARFELSRHPGETMVFAGFWGAVIGLVWRFAFPRPQPRGES